MLRMAGVGRCLCLAAWVLLVIASAIGCGSGHSGTSDMKGRDAGGDATGDGRLHRFLRSVGGFGSVSCVLLAGLLLLLDYALNVLVIAERARDRHDARATQVNPRATRASTQATTGARDRRREPPGRLDRVATRVGGAAVEPRTSNGPPLPQRPAWGR